MIVSLGGNPFDARGYEAPSSNPVSLKRKRCCCRARQHSGLAQHGLRKPRLERRTTRLAFALATSSHLPRIAMRHVEPLRVAQPADELFLLRIPLHLLTMVVSEVDEVTDNGRVRANF